MSYQKMKSVVLEEPVSPKFFDWDKDEPQYKCEKRIKHDIEDFDDHEFLPYVHKFVEDEIDD